MTMPLVTAPLQVEVLADPPDPDFETNWVPGPDGMRVEIRGLPGPTYVHQVRIWDSSAEPLCLGQVDVRVVLLDGDTLTVGCFSVN